MNYHLEQTCRCPNCDNRIGLLRNYNIETHAGNCSHCLINLPVDFMFRKYFKCETMNHKSSIKLFVNPILRKIQFWTMEPFVISSMANVVQTFPNYILFEFLGYKIQRVRYEKFDPCNRTKF
jgi:hypothetical protein